MVKISVGYIYGSYRKFKTGVPLFGPLGTLCPNKK